MPIRFVPVDNATAVLRVNWEVGRPMNVVGDADAFANTFYTELLNGKSIGAALCSGRAAVLKLKSADWADYLRYGSFDFVMRKGAGS
jgi:hypothetical protein